MNYNKGRKYALKYIKIHKERIKLMVPWENWHWNYYLFLVFCVTFSGPQWTERCDVLKSLHAHLASGHNRKEQRGTWQKWVALLLRLKGFYHCFLIAIIIRVLQWISFSRPRVILTSALSALCDNYRSKITLSCIREMFKFKGGCWQAFLCHHFYTPFFKQGSS